MPRICRSESDAQDFTSCLRLRLYTGLDDRHLCQALWCECGSAISLRSELKLTIYDVKVGEVTSFTRHLLYLHW